MTKAAFKAFRKELNLSRDDFAVKLGIGKDSVIAKELGRRAVTKRDELMIERLRAAQQAAT